MKIAFRSVLALSLSSGYAFAAEPLVSQQIASAVANATVSVGGQTRPVSGNAQQQAELTAALAARTAVNAADPKWKPGAPCAFNCPPPVGSITASPEVVAVPTGGMGPVSLRWTWDESRDRPVTEYSCLWASGGDEPDGHIVQCEHPGNTYTTRLDWIGLGSYTFRVAPGNPNGPYTKPISALQTIAQTTVVGMSQ